LSDLKFYEPSIRAPLETAAHFCEEDVLQLRSGVPSTIHLLASGEAIPFILFKNFAPKMAQAKA
jgi:hypothetical protein